MKDFLKGILKVLQVLFVLMIPILIIQYFFPQLTFLGFAGGINSASIAFFSQFVSMTIGGTDCTVLFLIVPWVFCVIISGIIINVVDEINRQITEKQEEAKKKKVIEMIHTREKLEEESLHSKHLIYMTISIVFSKFTISNLSDREIEDKKAEIKKDLIKDLPTCRGEVIEDEAFDDDDTFAVLFMSQDDALTFILKFRDLVSYYDDVTQSFGYSIAFRAIVDLQDKETSKLYELMFMEKALKAIELNEICATNDFANKYKKYGKMKHINFESKGNYSINKARVELNRIIV